MLATLLSAFGFLIPLVSGVLSTTIVGLLKTMSAALDKGPAWTKQLVSVVVATIVVAAANMLGVQLTGDPFTWNAHVPRETVQALIAALVAHVIHFGQKRDKAKAAALTTIKLDTKIVPTDALDPFRLP